MVQGGDEFTAFVASVQSDLQRSAWLLTASWEEAEDLVASRRRFLPQEDADGRERGSPAMVIVTPSGQLRNGQTVQVQLRGFPARRQVGLAECPTIRTRPNFSCSQAPAEVLLMREFAEFSLVTASPTRALGC